jgi:hypothetical protein
MAMWYLSHDMAHDKSSRGLNIPLMARGTESPTLAGEWPEELALAVVAGKLAIRGGEYQSPQRGAVN